MELQYYTCGHGEVLGDAKSKERGKLAAKAQSEAYLASGSIAELMRWVLRRRDV